MTAKDCWLEEQAPFAIYARTILEALRSHWWNITAARLASYCQQLRVFAERLQKGQLMNDCSIFLNSD
jgi:hypothetical protein